MTYATDLYNQIVHKARSFPQPIRGDIIAKALRFKGRDQIARLENLFVQVFGYRPVRGFGLYFS